MEVTNKGNVTSYTKFQIASTTQEQTYFQKCRLRKITIHFR